MLLFQKALQVAFTHIAVLFTLGGFVVSSFFSGNGLKVIDGRPATNPWLAGGLLLIEYTAHRLFKPTADHSMAAYPGYASTYAPVDVLRANQSLALVWNAVDVADLLPVIPSIAALVSASVSSSVSSVNAALFSKDEPHKALFDTGRPRCSASGSKSNGLATNGNNTLIDVARKSSSLLGQLSATRSSLSMGWKAGNIADALVVKGAIVPNVPSPTVPVSVSRVSSSTPALDATHFCLNEPNKALVDTGRPHSAASGFKKMEHMTTGTIMGTSSGFGDQCYADQFFAQYWKAGYGTCPSPVRPATVTPDRPMVVLPLAFIPSSINYWDATLFCLDEPNKVLLDSSRPRCAASGSKKKGQGSNGNNARKGAARKSSGSSGRSSNSSGSSSSGSSSGGSSGGSAPPPPPPPGRSGGVATRRSSRLQNSPRPDYALTTPRARRSLKVKEFEAPPDPPSDPPPPPPPNESDNHGPYDVGDLYDPSTPWLKKVMIFIFCTYAACNMSSRLVRVVPRRIVVSMFLSLKQHFLKLEGLVTILLERANNWFRLASAPAPNFASQRIHVPAIWQSPDGAVNPFPVFAEAPSEVLQLRFPAHPDDILEALVQAGLIERARGPLFGLRKYLSRLIIAIIGVFAALLMLDIDWLRDMVEGVMGVNTFDNLLRAGVAELKCDSLSSPVWLAPGIDYEYDDLILDQSYLAPSEASPSVECNEQGKLNEDAENIPDASDDLSTVLRNFFEQKPALRAHGEKTASDASFHPAPAGGLNEEAPIACALVFLAAYLLQQQDTARLEAKELAADKSLRMTEEEDVSAETTPVEQAKDMSSEGILEKNSLEVIIQNSVEVDCAWPCALSTVDTPGEPINHIHEDATIHLAVSNELAVSSSPSRSPVHQECSPNSVATAYDSINDTVTVAFEIEKTTSPSLQTDAIELTKLDKTPEAATGSSSTVTDLSAPVESERTGDASAKASNFSNEPTSELDSSVHGPAHEPSTSSATAPSDPRGPGIWSPPVTEIDGYTFVVVEGGRRQRKRHRKAKAPANPVAVD